MKNRSGLTLIELIVYIFIALILIIGVVKGVGGCKQISARQFGGSMTYTLDPNQKLVTCTWKDNQLWLLTTTRPTNDSPMTYHFIEKSLMGVLQGNVTIQEK